MGSKGTTPNEAVLGDLGWWTLKARRDMMRLRYWRKLTQMGEDRLPKKIYLWGREDVDSDSWCGYTRDLLKELGLEEYWLGYKEMEDESKWKRIILITILKINLLAAWFI